MNKNVIIKSYITGNFLTLNNIFLKKVIALKIPRKYPTKYTRKYQKRNTSNTYVCIEKKPLITFSGSSVNNMETKKNEFIHKTNPPGRYFNCNYP